MKKLPYLRYLRQYRFHSLLAKSAVLILSVTLVTNLSLGLLSYYKTNSRLAEEVRHTNQEALHRIERLFSTYATGAVSAAIHLATSNDSVRLSVNYEDETLFTNYRTIDRLSSLMDMMVSGNPFIHSIYVYLAESGLIVTSEETSRVGYFYDIGWIDAFRRMRDQKNRPKFSYETLSRELYEMSGKRVPGISYLTALPLTSDTVLGCIVVNLSIPAMQMSASSEMIGLMDYLAVYDSADRQLFTCGSNPGSEATVATVVSGVNGWRYSVHTDYGTLRIYTGSLGRFLVFTVVLCIGAGMVLTGIVAVRLYRPFLRLHERLETGRENFKAFRDEAEYLQEGVGNAIAEREEYDHLIRDNFEFLKGNFLQNVLKGVSRFRNSELLRKRAGFYRLRTDFEQPVMLLLACVDPTGDGERSDDTGSVAQPEKFEIYKLQALYKTAGALPDADVFDYGDHDIGILLNAGNEFRETALRFAETCLGSIRRSIGIDASILAGPAPVRLETLHETARKIDRFRRYRFAIDPGEIVFYDDFDFAGGSDADQVEEYREKVIFYLKGGEFDSCESTFKEMLRLMEGSSLSNRRKDNILMQLIAAVELEAREAQIEEPELFGRLKAMANVTGVSGDLSLAEIQFHYVFEHMCRIIRHRKFEHKEDVVRRAVNFITANYTRDISLDDVAVSVDLSAPYLSKVFGEIKGEGFKEFISRLRIEKAVILLQTTDTPANQLYSRLGFTNISTFYRVFKKYTGMTPDAVRTESRAPRHVE